MKMFTWILCVSLLGFAVSYIIKYNDYLSALLMIVIAAKLIFDLYLPKYEKAARIVTAAAALLILILRIILSGR